MKAATYQEQTGASMTFYAAVCEELHSMQACYEGLSLEEAVEKYFLLSQPVAQTDTLEILLEPVPTLPLQVDELPVLLRNPDCHLRLQILLPEGMHIHHILPMILWIRWKVRKLH